MVILIFTIGLTALIKQAVEQIEWKVETQPEKATPVPPNQPATDIPDDGEIYLTYLHLTTEDAAQTILAIGIQPFKGERSSNDRRFFAVTQDSGPLPRPTSEQINDMLGDITVQLRMSYPQEQLAILQLRLPQRVVNYLEQSQQLYYGPFFPNSAPGYTEAIFEMASFPTINQYRYNWSYTLVEVSE